MPDAKSSLLLCDLTQSWSETGGGVPTYLRHKRAWIARETPHRHLLIIPGASDAVERDGRLVTATIASPRVPGSPNYRLLLRNRAVRRLLDAFAPDFVECLDAYNLPWAALAHRRHRPETVLVAGYRTDFPSAYVRRTGARWFGETVGGKLERLCYRYCRSLYGRFDGLYALGEHGGAARLRELGLAKVEVLPLGVDLEQFSPARRSAATRAALGVGDDEPLLVYAGRIDNEKRCMTVFDAFRKLPDSRRATLVMLGEGKLRGSLIEASSGLRAHFPGYVEDRDLLATLLASADLYVSGMADETFGISIIEAQAAGLPVVGVAAGAMLDRVPEGLGRLGPVDDSGAMAANILALLDEGAAAAGARARAHVAGLFSWPRTFEKLLGEIYPHAAARRRAALAEAAGTGHRGAAAVTGEL